MSQDNPTLLAFDCSGASCSAAVLSDGTIQAARFESMARGQAEALLPMIEAVMREAGITFPALDAIVTTIGPGSFTGVRIGIAAARGLALAAGKPTIGITSFEAVYAGFTKDFPAMPAALIIDSKRGTLFTQLFDARGQIVGEAVSLEPGALAAWLPEGPVRIGGDGVAQLDFLRGDTRFRLSDEPDLIRAEALVRAADEMDRRGGGELRPLYMRAPDVTQPKIRPGVKQA